MQHIWLKLRSLTIPGRQRRKWRLVFYDCPDHCHPKLTPRVTCAVRGPQQQMWARLSSSLLPLVPSANDVITHLLPCHWAPAAAWTNSHKSGSPNSGRALQRLLACRVSSGREHEIERKNVIHAEWFSLKGSFSSQLQLEGISSESGSGLTLAGEIRGRRVKSGLALTAKTWLAKAKNLKAEYFRCW